MYWNGFKGAAVRATEADIADIARKLGVPYFRLRGIVEVEAPKGPFDRKGRPTMLFEPFQFWKRLPAAKRKAAVAAGCAMSRRPKRGEYPADSYPVLEKALIFDETTALASCSWGRGQVMGFNYVAAGFKDVAAMVSAAMASEANQLRQMAGFIKANGLVKHLKSGDAEAFALGYNGEGYARDGYHTKIRKAWAKWEKMPVPSPSGFLQAMPPDENTEAVPAPLPAITDRKTVEFVQQRLRDLGYTEVGKVDGGIGTLTEGALRIFRADNGLPAGATIDANVLVALGTAEPRKLAPARVNATAADVREVAPEAKASWRQKIFAAVVGFPTAVMAFVNGVVGNIGEARGYIDPVKDMLGDVPSWFWLGAVATTAGVIWYSARQAEAASVEAVQTGARR